MFSLSEDVFSLSEDVFSLSEDVCFYLLDYYFMFFLHFSFFHFVASYHLFCFLNSQLLQYINSFSRLFVSFTSFENACNDKSITISSVSNCFYFVL